MSRIVRSSKFRHVFGKASKRDACYDNLKPSKSAWDSNKVKVNNRFVGCIWEARGGGSFTILNKEKTGKYPTNIPLVSGHKGHVLDIDASPHNDYLFASVSEDGYGRIWAVPEGGLTENLVEPTQTLLGHRRKVGTANFHPLAANVLATSSSDYTVKVWDIEKGEAMNSVSGYTDIIQSVAWSPNGAQIATSSKDKKLRILDPRSNSIAGEAANHPGVKGSRVCWLGNTGKLISIGFSRSSDRSYMIFDPSSLDKPLCKANIDTSSGILMPFFDSDTNMLYLAGKGDGNIRYYEIVNDKPYIHYLSEYKSSSPQLGMGFEPKTSCDVSNCEVAKAYKVNNQFIEPISFVVPRKATEMFQDDLFPDTVGPTPSMTASEWFGGANKEGIKISLEAGFKAPEKVELKVEKKVADEGPKGEVELRKAYEEQKKRIAYLEAEIAKRDQKIKELS